MAFHCIRCKAAIEKTYRACPHCAEPVTDFLRRYADEPVDGKYKILERLGTGGMGEVYKVEHTILGTIRVIKVIRPQISSSADAHDRFLREARIATKIQHTNVATMYDFAALPDGSHYMVWEFIDGENIAQRLQRRGTLPPREAVHIAVDALRGLDAIHRAGIVHRDISPENIMLVRDVGAVKVIDLGVAKSNEPSDDATRAGVFVGKLRYASPEHLGFLEEGERIDGRADLYSMAMVLYEMLAGRPPFEATSPHEYILMHSRDIQIRELDLAPSTPGGPELQAVLRRAFERDRNRRHATAGEFAAALEEVERKLPDPRAMATVAGAEFDGDATIRVAPAAGIDRNTVHGSPAAEPTLRTPLPGAATVRTPLPGAAGEFETIMRQPLPPPADSNDYETMMGAAPRDLKTVAAPMPAAALPEVPRGTVQMPVAPPPPPPAVAPPAPPPHVPPTAAPRAAAAQPAVPPRVAAAPTVATKRGRSPLLIAAIVTALLLAAGAAALFLSRSSADTTSSTDTTAAPATVSGATAQTSLDVVNETAPPAAVTTTAPAPTASATTAPPPAADEPAPDDDAETERATEPARAATPVTEETETNEDAEPEPRVLGAARAVVYTEGGDDNEAALETLRKAVAGVDTIAVRGPAAPMLMAVMREELPAITLADDAAVTIHFTGRVERLGRLRKQRFAEAIVLKHGRAVFRYVMPPQIYRAGDTPAEAFVRVLAEAIEQ